MKIHPQLPALAPGYSLVDSHCHLDMDAYQDDLDEVIACARNSGVTRIVTIGVDLASSRQAVRLAGMHDGVYAAVGLHPHEAASAGQDVYDQLCKLAAEPKVVAWGEIGLDYAKQHAPADVQLRAFADQLDLAKARQLPVIIHDRDAHADVLGLLREKAPFPRGGVLHCFAGDSWLAGQVLELGLHVSISGIVTFQNAAVMRQVVRDVPLEWLLLETDGPFLAPVPWRGKRNRPDYLLRTAAAVAELKGLSLNEVAQQTTLNAERLFSLSDHER